MELRLDQRHVMALNLLLIVGLTYFAALCVNDVVARTMARNAPSARSAARTRLVTTGPRTRARYDAIVKRDIFNLTPQEVARAPVVVEDLHLKLLGTSTLTKSKPYAILEDPNGQQSLYQLGEDIPDAGKLVSVELARVIIDHNGRRVAIDLPSTDLPIAEPSRLGVAPNLPNVPRLRGPRGRAMPLTPPGLHHRAPRSEDEDATDKEDEEDKEEKDDDSESKLDLKQNGPGKFAANRDAIVSTMKDPSALMTHFRAQPHLNDGAVDGFSISEVDHSPLFEKLGLKNGDTVTNIDGQPVTGTMQVMSIMAAVQNKPSVDVTVTRGGSPIKLHLDLH